MVSITKRGFLKHLLVYVAGGATVIFGENILRRPAATDPYNSNPVATVAGISYDPDGKDSRTAITVSLAGRSLFSDYLKVSREIRKENFLTHGGSLFYSIPDGVGENQSRLLTIDLILSEVRTADENNDKKLQAKIQIIGENLVTLREDWYDNGQTVLDYDILLELLRNSSQ